MFDLEVPTEDYVLTLQAWDRDLFKPNDFICEWTFNLEDLINVAKMTRGSGDFNQIFWDSRKNEPAYASLLASNSIKWKTETTFILYGEINEKTGNR